MSSAATASTLIQSQVKPSRIYGREATRGAFWTILLSVANKVTAVASQIALAWFLLPEDMGLVAVALSISSMTLIFSGTSLKNVLIQKENGFEEVAGQVFWLSLAMNAVCALLLAGISPLAGRLYGEPRVVSLLWIVCGALPIMALPTIYAASLYRDLRFGTMAKIHFGEGLIRNGLAVPLAAAGWGAYSLIAPMLVSALFSFICVRCSVGGIKLAPPNLRAWPGLLRPALWLMLISMVTALQSNGTNLVLGLFRNPLVSGLFFWGFSLSSQAVFLLATNLQGVFFPILTKLNGKPNEQRELFLKLCSILLLAIIPVCVLQCVLAEPFIRLVFNERWVPAAPVVQWLSLGMVTQPLGILASSLLLAKGKNKELAALNTMVALSTIFAAALGAWLGEQREIGICVGLAMIISNGYAGWTVYRRFCSADNDRFGKIFLPLALLVPLGILGWAGGKFFHCGGNLGKMLAVTILILVSYCGLVRAFFPHLAREILHRLPIRILR